MASATIISRHSLKWSQENNSIIVRLVDLGTWNVIRCGFLHSVRQDSLTGGITPDFAVGFCAGTSAVFGDASVTHFVGLSNENVTAWTLSGANFLSAVLLPTKKVGVTKTTGSAFSFPAKWITYANTTADLKRSMTILTITKGSPNYSFDLFYRDSETASDPTFANLTTQMEAGTPAFTSHINSATRTLAVDEGVDGTLTAFQAYWSLTTSSLELEGVIISKVS